MKTFAGEYSGNNFTFSDDAAAIRMQLISILNTPLGSRYYYPDYGSRISEYRFTTLNHFSINLIGSEIKRAISLINGVTLSSISYSLDDGVLNFNIALSRLSDNINLSVSVVDGAVS